MDFISSNVSVVAIVVAVVIVLALLSFVASRVRRVPPNEALIVVDKPAGLVVHPAAGNLDGTLVNALLHHCAGQLSGIGGVARPGIVHRIDKDTSGLMVAAKTDRAHEGLARQFAAHTIDRRYRAIVAGLPRPAAEVVDALAARGVLAGVPYSRLEPGVMDDVLLVAATETTTEQDIEALASGLAEVTA